jgi:hypothetical protein
VCAAEHVSTLYFIGWISGMDISYQGYLLDETQFYRLDICLTMHHFEQLMWTTN